MKKARILIIEDDPDGRQSLVDAVQDGGMLVDAAATGEDGIALFATGTYDVVLSDLVLPDIDGIEVLSRLKKKSPDLPILIMTAYGSITSSVRAMKEGAYDYLTKPLDLDDLHAKLSRALEAGRLRQEVTRLRKTVASSWSAETLVAVDDKSIELTRQIQAVAKTNATVLIQGESGTGKELIARALHADGPRAAMPFVAVNCGALTESLLESELFGHEKGSFTGATRQHQGAFERADGGTLFLDEISTAPSSVQIKLLRVLEQREITRIGGQATLPVDVRVVSAANRDLEELVEEGSFREDLLYRLKVVTLEALPLRERAGDIRPLTDHFIDAICTEHGRRIDRVDETIYVTLAAYDWPGNVRQLRNVVESAVVMSTSPTLSSDSVRLPSARAEQSTPFDVPTDMSLEDMEREIFIQALARNEGNRTLTAEQLHISRRTIQRKIKELNLPF